MPTSKGHLKKKKKRHFLKSPTSFLLKDEFPFPVYFTNIDYLGGIFIFLLSFGVYLHTLTPTISFHDCGELVAASYLLGIAHPPGYPLYCLLGKMWMTIMPIGNIAYRMNLGSALCGALIAMMVYFISLKVGSGKWEVGSKENKLIPRLLSLIPAVVAALVLAFAPIIWEQAVISEKYILNALFVTLLIFILLKWQGTILPITNHRLPITNHRLPTKYLYLFAFTLGLSFTHHFQTMFLLPASIFLISIILLNSFLHDLKNMVVKTTKDKKNLFLRYILKFWAYLKSLFKTLFPYLKTLALMFLLFIIPLCLWFYLPWRAAHDPPLNWGSPDTMDRFIRHITTQDFKGYMSSSPMEILNRLTHHLTHFFPHQFTLPLVIIGLVGIFFLIKQKRLIGLFLLLIVLTDIGVSVRYNIYNIEDYYIPAFIIFSIFIGYGLSVMIRLTHSLPVSCLLLFIPLIPFSLYYHTNDRSHYFFAYDYGRNLLRPVEENGIVFLKGLDNDAFPVWYLHYAEHIKPDVDLVSILFMYFDWYPQQLTHLKPDKPYSFTGEKDIMRVRFDNIFFNSQRPIYTHYDENFANDYSLVYAGTFYRVLNKHTSNDILLKELDKHNLRLMFRGVKDDKIHKDDRAKMIVNNYISIYNNYGIAYNRFERYSEASKEYSKALRLNPDNPDTYFNIGVAYSNSKRYDEAIHKFKQAVALDTNYVKAYKSIGNVYENKKELDEAIKWYKKAIEIEPKDIENHRNLARLYYEMGNINEVIEVCKRMIDIDPQNIESHNNLGSLYFKGGNYKKAILEFKEVLKLDPTNAYASNMLAKITGDKKLLDF